jgi:hypothetical protein
MNSRMPSRYTLSPKAYRTGMTYFFVIPAQAGIQRLGKASIVMCKSMDSSFHGNDGM